MLSEGGIEVDLDSQSISAFIDNDFIDQLPEIGVADLPFLYDLFNQIKLSHREITLLEIYSNKKNSFHHFIKKSMPPYKVRFPPCSEILKTTSLLKLNCL